MRKAHLERLLASRPDGIFISPFEQGEIGPDLFRAACNMGLEGLVSKRRDRPYRGGRSKDWMKVKKPQAPSNGAREGRVLMILRCADRPYRAWTDESKEILRRSCLLRPQQRRESRQFRDRRFGPDSDFIHVRF